MMRLAAKERSESEAPEEKMSEEERKAIEKRPDVMGATLAIIFHSAATRPLAPLSAQGL